MQFSLIISIWFEFIIIMLKVNNNFVLARPLQESGQYEEQVGDGQPLTDAHPSSYTERYESLGSGSQVFVVFEEALRFELIGVRPIPLLSLDVTDER